MSNPEGDGLSSLKRKRLDAKPIAHSVGAAAVEEGDNSPEPPPELQEASPYIIGEVEERKRKGEPIKVIVVYDGAKKRLVTESQVGLLPNAARLEVGDVVALERSVGPDATGLITIIDNLGKKGNSKTEIARVAYMIGNGEVPPKAVRDIEEKIQTEGQGLVEKEIADLKARNALPHWDNTDDYKSQFEHGKSRVDFRDLTDRFGKNVSVMTVDPQTARDHDDALHAREVEIDGKEYVEVGVHIADVSHFVPIDKNHPWYALFERAKDLGFTLYSPRKAFPMLPHVLSEKLCSLTEGDNRLSFSTVFLLEKETGNIVKTWQGKSVMRCDAKLPYENAQQLLDTTDVADDDVRKPHHTGLTLLKKYGKKLRDERVARKEVAFPDRNELDAIVDADSGEAVAGVKEPLEMNRVVQDWMIQANEAKAITITNKMLESPDTFFTFLRYHEPPSLESIKIIAEIHKAEDILRRIQEFEQAGGEEKREVGSAEPSFINQIVYDLLKFGEQLDVAKWREESMRASAVAAAEKGEPHPLVGATPEETEKNILARLDYLRGDDRQRLQSQVLRLFSKAKYTTDPLAHFSLSKFPYTNGTSPIRRFADVIVHHLLEAALENDSTRLAGITRDELASIAEHLNLREKIIDQASERTKAIWGAELFDQLRTTDNPQPELSNVMVTAMFTKAEGKKSVQMLKVQMRHPSGPFIFSFEIPRRNVRGFPSKNEEAYEHELIRKPLIVKLTDVDVASGMLWLQLEGKEEIPSLRTRMQPELLNTMKQIAINDIEDLEIQFPEIMNRSSDVRNEVRKLKTLIGTVTTATPVHIITGIGARTGALQMILRRHSSLSLEELLARRRNAVLRSETPRLKTFATEEERTAAIQKQLRLLEIRELRLRNEALKKE